MLKKIFLYAFALLYISNVSAQLPFSFLQTNKSQYKKLYANVSKPKDKTLLADTVIVGAIPNDTLKITGTWSHTGPIFVGNDGVLQINKATFNNDGGLIVFGHGKVFIDSSSITFPQPYQYARTLYVGQNGMFSIKNSTIDFSGVPYGFSILDSAKVTMSSIFQTSFMTCGLSSHASININGSNIAGEFLVSDYSKINLKNVTEALAWHDFPDTCVVNWSFGTKDTVTHYSFDKSQPGLKGIESSITIDSSNNVLWGMMVHNGCDVTINDSKVRTIGMLFYQPHDSVTISGLYNYSTYSSYKAPVSDRSLQFNNSYVNTWSVYVSDRSKIYLTNNLLGEVISYYKSNMFAQSTTIDGSGGHVATQDSSFAFMNQLTATCEVRSEAKSLFVIANSDLTNANVYSIGTSVIIVSQSPVGIGPNPLEGSTAWYANINDPGAIYIDSTFDLNGSAFIDRGPSGNLMDFSHWQLFYQKQGDVSWTVLTGEITTEVRNNLLVKCNTHGLTTGLYNIQLTLTDNWHDSINATKQVLLLANPLGIATLNGIQRINVYPVPSNGQLFVSVNSTVNENAQLNLYDSFGNTIIHKTINIVSGENTFDCSDAGVASGFYTLEIRDQNGFTIRKIAVE